MSDQWFYIRMWKRQREEQEEMEKNLTKKNDDDKKASVDSKETMSIEEIKKKYETSQDSTEWIYIFNEYYGEKK